LQWPAGHVQDILDGKAPQPEPAVAERQPVAVAGEPTRIPRGVSRAIGDLAADLVPIVEAEVRRARMRHSGRELNGRDIFADEHEAAIWDIPGLGSRYEVVALLRAVRQRDEGNEAARDIPRNAK
jgi:hypothetical protein